MAFADSGMFFILLNILFGKSPNSYLATSRMNVLANTEWFHQNCKSTSKVSQISVTLLDPCTAEVLVLSAAVFHMLFILFSGNFNANAAFNISAK